MAEGLFDCGKGKPRKELPSALTDDMFTAGENEIIHIPPVVVLIGDLPVGLLLRHGLCLLSLGYRPVYALAAEICAERTKRFCRKRWKQFIQAAEALPPQPVRFMMQVNRLERNQIAGAVIKRIGISKVSGKTQWRNEKCRRSIDVDHLLFIFVPGLQKLQSSDTGVIDEKNDWYNAVAVQSA